MEDASTTYRQVGDTTLSPCLPCMRSRSGRHDMLCAPASAQQPLLSRYRHAHPAGIRQASMQNTQRAAGFSWKDLPGPAVLNCLGCLASNGHDLARLSTCCKPLHDAVQQPGLWQVAITSRFGRDYLPAVKPSGPLEPQEVQGWVFYPGAHLPESTPGSNHSPAAPDVLAKAAADKGADAFDTWGKVYTEVPPASMWRRGCFHPAQGVYVREVVVQVENLPPPPAPAAAADIEWPPRQVPGWQYIPGVERLTHTSRPYTAPYFAPNTATQLEEVLEAAGAPPFMITTQGAVISEAWPPNAWVRCADPCKGVYVPRALFQALHPLPRWLTLTLAAVEHPEDPAAAAALLRHRYAELSQLRLQAGQLSGAWLDDHHIVALAMPASPTGLVVVLRSVCWLHLHGEIPGVTPGEWDVVWHMGLDEPFSLPDAANLSAEASPQQVEGEGAVQNTAGGDAAAAAAAAPPSRVTTTVSARQLRELRQRSDPQQAWIQVPGGTIRVEQLSKVCVEFKEVGPGGFGAWKSGLVWAYVELVPHQESQRRTVRGRRSNQQQRQEDGTDQGGGGPQLPRRMGGGRGGAGLLTSLMGRLLGQ